MTKRLRVVFLIAIVYFLIIIPVQSQQNTELFASEIIQDPITVNEGETIQSEMLQIPSNDSQQNTGNEENISGLIQLPEIQENVSEYNSGIDETGVIGQKIGVPHIIISEIYYDGTEEWIEITNLGNDFSGSLEIQVPQQIFFSINIQQNQSIILTKSSQTYVWVSPLVNQQALSSSFSFTDTKAISVSLFRSGEIIDSFQVETGLVTKYNDKKTSLIKQYNNQVGFITGSTSAVNVTNPYIASPGIWENQNISGSNNGDVFGTGSNSVTTTSGNIQTGNSQTTSGSDLGGGGMSGIVEIPIPISPQPGILEITEIYQGTGQYASFIEIKAIQDFSGKMFFSGSLLETSLELETNLEKNERFLIVYSDNHRLSDQKRIIKTSLDLNTSGFLQILGQSGQVFDTIQILTTSLNKSNYNGPFSNGSIDIFSKIDYFSPGFDEKFLVYFSGFLLNNTGQYNQNTGFTYQTDSGSVSTSGAQIGPDLSGFISSGWIPAPKDIVIISLQHKNPETITLQSNLNIDIDLSKKDRYLLTKETQTGDRKTSKKYLTGILIQGTSITIPKTRGFLDAGSCVGLFYQTGQLDQRCYGSALSKLEEDIQPELEDDIPNIQILGVLPNPVGKDDKEELHLLRIPNTQLDSLPNEIKRKGQAGSKLELPPKSLYIKINNTKKYLVGTLNANTGTILIGSLGLVNKSVCLELLYKNTLLDTFCYPDPKEGKFLQKGQENIQDETGFIDQYIPNIHIQGLLPNPKGKDDQEMISIFRTHNTGLNLLFSSTGSERQSFSDFWYSEGNDFYSSEGSGFCHSEGSGFCHSEGNEEYKASIKAQSFQIQPKSLYLLNNKTKTYFSGFLHANTGTIFRGSLGLLNKAHCTELRYSGTQLDRFCYPNPKEDQYFGTGNIILQTIQKSDFNILQKVGFIVTGSQICVNYYDQFLTCRSLPASKTSIKLKNENKLYKSYFSLFQNYLIKDRSTLYYNTDIKAYFDTFKQAKSFVSKPNSTIIISGQQFDIYDLSGQIQLTTAQQGLSGNQNQDQISWRSLFLHRLGL